MIVISIQLRIKRYSKKFSFTANQESEFNAALLTLWYIRLTLASFEKLIKARFWLSKSHFTCTFCDFMEKTMRSHLLQHEIPTFAQDSAVTPFAESCSLAFLQVAFRLSLCYSESKVWKLWILENTSCRHLFPKQLMNFQMLHIYSCYYSKSP
jgi:hypothetical protein